MKIVVTATGPSLDDMVEPRFGRAPWYVFVDTDTTEFEAVRNPNVAAGGGAGIQSAQLMSDYGVSHVLTGNCGPNAFQVFGAAGIQVVVGVSGTVRQAVEQFRTGAFAAASSPNVESHFGMGSGGAQAGGMGMAGGSGAGMGRGMGMGGGRGSGMGRGMGMGGGQGMGRGMGPVGGPVGTTPQSGQTKDALREELKMLREQMSAIEKRIREIDENE